MLEDLKQSEKPPIFNLWIAGESASPETGQYFDVLNPLDDSLYAIVAEGSSTDIDLAVQAANKAFLEYRNSTPKDREAWLCKAAELLLDRQELFMNVLADEIGSPLFKANHEVTYSAELLRAAAGITRQVSGKTLPSDIPNRLSMTLREPLGVIANITPFNIPLLKPIKFSANALATGNTVVLLPSEEAPVIARHIAQLFLDAGFPPGTFNVVSGHGDKIGDSLITHPLVRVVTFTGSSRVGKHIHSLCGTHGKRLTLELGGKSPLVILKDANLAKAIPAATFGMFAFQGQICMGSSRIFVERPIFDVFLKSYAGAAKSLSMGDLRDPKTMIGPIINERQRNRVHSHIEDALGKGATLATGGKWHENRCEPTILTDVTKEMTLYAEETFGPVTSVYPIDSAAEGLERANDTHYGLSAAIFTENLSNAFQFARGIKSGMVHINGATLSEEPHVPAGGVGESGFGREGTEADLELMTELKWLTIQL